MGVKELAVVMDLAREVSILLARGLEHDLENCQSPRTASLYHKPYLGAIGELV